MFFHDKKEYIKGPNAIKLTILYQKTKNIKNPISKIGTEVKNNKGKRRKGIPNNMKNKLLRTNGLKTGLSYHITLSLDIKRFLRSSGR